ncbi:MAG: hypothetical protein KKG92_01290 [Gammaproteobacteria bacterium]|nr:hypothetical protein [Gammaproteobacteria bacterium]
MLRGLWIEVNGIPHSISSPRSRLADSLTNPSYVLDGIAGRHESTLTIKMATQDASHTQLPGGTA